MEITVEKLLLIDDDSDIREQLKWGLCDSYTILQAGDVNEGLALAKKHSPKVVILDLGLPPHTNSSIEGFRGLGELLTLNPHVKVIMLTGNSEHENALKAIQMGAYDFLAKPPAVNELSIIAARAFHLSKLEEHNRSLQSAVEQKSKNLGGMIGQSPKMEAVFSTISKVAPSDVSIFISGENGTGKELVAQAIHEASLRRNGPFIPINCGAIPENLLEAELFGHEKGAFTGAYATVQGKVQYANNGTLFLDEIGEMPVNLQVKLLRFLQEGVIQRVGGRVDLPVNARVVCATNINIEQAIQDGKFREDLYYRISVININLPPLRERGDDILILANHFLRLFCEEHKKKIRRFSASAISFMKNYEWPGNVRELRNRIQRAVIMTEASALEACDLGDLGQQPELSISTTTLKDARDQLERDMVAAEIDRQSGNLVKAAEALGVSRPTIYDLMKKHNLTPHNPAEK